MYYNDFTKTSRFRWNEEKGKPRSGSSAEEERHIRRNKRFVPSRKIKSCVRIYNERYKSRYTASQTVQVKEVNENEKDGFDCFDHCVGSFSCFCRVRGGRRIA